MRMKWRTGLWVIFLCALPACYGGSSIVHQFDLKPDYRPSPWKKIAVLPFSGDQRFTRVAAEWFAHHLQKQSHFSIVTPTFAEIEIQKLGISSNEDGLSPKEARQAARSLGADALFMDGRPIAIVSSQTNFFSERSGRCSTNCKSTTSPSSTG